MRSKVFLVFVFASLSYSLLAYDVSPEPDGFCRIVCGIPPWKPGDNEGTRAPSEVCQQMCLNTYPVSPGRLKRSVSQKIQKMDIVFAVDTSRMIDNIHFKMAKSFINEFTGMVHVGPDDVQIGLGKYSTEWYEQYPLSLYKNRKQVAVANVGLKRSGLKEDKTRTDIAIRSVIKMFEDDGRKDADHVCILLTIGNSQDLQLTKSAVDKARKEGISIFPVAIGFPDEWGEEEIAAIAETNKLEFTVASLTDLVQAIGVQTSSKIGSDPNSKTDVIVMFDNSVNIEDLELGKIFIANFVEQLNINQNAIRIALFTFNAESSSITEVLGLTESDSREKVKNAVKGITRNGVKKVVKNYARAMTEMITNFKKYGRGRGNRVQYVGVLISNGLIPGQVTESEKENQRLLAKDAVKIAEADPYRIFQYTVSVGRVLNRKMLSALARASCRHLNVADVTKMAHNIWALGETLEK